jgi:hypothetical protein
MTQIKMTKGYGWVLISAIESRSNSSALSSLLSQHRREQSAMGVPWPVAMGALACSTVHQTPVRYFLHDLGYERESIYSLATAKAIERRPATRRRLRKSSTVTWAASNTALAPRFSLTTMVQVGAPPRSVESAQDASLRRIDGGGLVSRQIHTR